jgi:LysM repeat protein
MRIPLAVAVLFLAAKVSAQTAPPAPPPAQDQDASESEGKAVQEPSGQVRTQPRTSGTEAGANAEAPGTVHTVVKGDTLWDLSQHYLGSPWYWPKVWSYNPQIANPHWIYPGNQVRFYTGSGEEPAGQVEVEIEPGSGTMGEGNISLAEPVQEDTVEMVGPKPYEPKGRERLPRQGFVTDRELERNGLLSKSFAETQMLTTGDIVYLQFKDPAAAVVGKEYVVYRPDRKVYHPRSGKLVGYLTLLLGRVRVLQTNDPYYVRAQVSYTFNAMYRGDYIGPPGEQMVLTVAPVPNTNARDLEGAVVAAINPYIAVNAERSQVVADLGSAEGVQQGNTFTIVRQADPMEQAVDPALNQDTRLPMEVVGRCIAAEVKEHASTCMLLRTVREIVPGDRLVLFGPSSKAPVSTR